MVTPAKAFVPVNELVPFKRAMFVESEFSAVVARVTSLFKPVVRRLSAVVARMVSELRFDVMVDSADVARATSLLIFPARNPSAVCARLVSAFNPLLKSAKELDVIVPPKVVALTFVNPLPLPAKTVLVMNALVIEMPETTFVASAAFPPFKFVASCHVAASS